jgi:hypothetical protein
MVTMIIIGAAKEEEVRVIDCGHQYDPYIGFRMIGERTAILDQIRLKNATSCEQVVKLLENAASMDSARFFSGFRASYSFEKLTMPIKSFWVDIPVVSQEWPPKKGGLAGDRSVMSGFGPPNKYWKQRKPLSRTAYAVTMLLACR